MINPVGGVPAEPTMFAVLFLAMTKPSRSILFAIAAIAGFNQFCYFQLSLTDQLTLAGLVLRPTLSDFFCYIAVQTIASPISGGFSLSRSRCFRFRPVAHFWASKSIRETYSICITAKRRIVCLRGQKTYPKTTPNPGS